MQTMTSFNGNVNDICSRYGITKEQFNGIYAEIHNIAPEQPKATKPPMTFEEAEDKLFAKIEKSIKRGGEIPEKQVWAQFGL